MNHKEWIKDLAIAVVAPGFTAWLAKFEWSFWQSLSLVLVAAVIFLATQLWRAKRKPQAKSDERPRVADITLLLSDESADIVNAINSCTSSFYFLGISSARTANNNALLAKLAVIARAGGDVRFLLFDPESPHMARRANAEGAPPELWKKDIAATVLRLKSAAQANGTEFQIKYYENFPLWRMIIRDRRAIRLNYFLDRNRLTDSPTLQLENTTDGIAQTFLRHFDEIWSSARSA